ncbi:folylpolyglutamate synthase [Pelotomaculum thermopropionicum SI]|uniref:tetrahydrofolate synthase n=1 Tax=Pelotomaculum thermopropionicum (strain DSM 13744 / JCM 10971 / SI) TaxID=370438 RepID=A5D456_PELTS|nr:folylpolyglutamate synthase [Pelotomaculum thermopropionicum SI]
MFLVNYEEALSYLSDRSSSGIRLGLGRIKELLRRLGNPHLDLKAIHIGGTNGKGSTAVMLAGILQKAGYRTGAFTSPHLHSFTERYRIDGACISRERIAELTGEMRPHLEAMAADGFERPTGFEAGTALAFLYFSREKVDYLVLEVGLGGRCDATNVVRPLLSVITNVSVDHQEYLGNSIREIAGEKAGIIKRGVPTVTAAAGEALEVIEDTCRKRNSPLTVVGRDVRWEHVSLSEEGQCFTICGLKRKYEDIGISLLGRHQQVNAATAVAAVEVLMDLGVDISAGAVRAGLAARWPGRLEVMRRKPLVIIDGAHNYEGARSLRRALADHFPGREMVLVIGMLDDKERFKVVAELAPAARAVVVTRPDSPRAAKWQQLAVAARRHVREVYLEELIEEAVEKALSLAGPEDLVCFTGSFYLIAGVRKLLAQ